MPVVAVDTLLTVVASGVVVIALAVHDMVELWAEGTLYANNTTVELPAGNVERTETSVTVPLGSVSVTVTF